VNSGALIRGTIFHLEGRREPVEKIGQRIKEIVGTVLSRARAEEAPPSRVAAREAQERIERWREA